jgi:DNA-binding transcriptional MocR family regulator
MREAEQKEDPCLFFAGSNFSPSGSFGDCIRMAFTFYEEEALAKAGAVMGEAVARLSKKTAEHKSD